MQGGTQEFKTIIGHNKHCNLNVNRIEGRSIEKNETKLYAC